MDNPEYTETQVNKSLRIASQRDIRIKWDGAILDGDNVPEFDVWFNGDTTPFSVRDFDRSFEINEIGDRDVSHYVGYAISYQQLAAKLAETIEEAISAGQLFDEGEDA